MINNNNNKREIMKKFATVDRQLNNLGVSKCQPLLHFIQTNGLPSGFDHRNTVMSVDNNGDAYVTDDIGVNWYLRKNVLERFSVSVLQKRIEDAIYTEQQEKKERELQIERDRELNYVPPPISTQTNTFEELIDAILENNSSCDVNWDTWEDCDHVEVVYGQLDCDHVEVARAFINALITSNGDNLSIYRDAYRSLNC